jgi:hypothetical protein
VNAAVSTTISLYVCVFLQHYTYQGKFLRTKTATKQQAEAE